MTYSATPPATARSRSSRPGSRAAAKLADEHVLGDTVGSPPLLGVLEVNRVGQFRRGLVGYLPKSCLSQQVNDFLPAVLHGGDLLGDERSGCFYEATPPSVSPRRKRQRSPTATGRMIPAPAGCQSMNASLAWARTISSAR